uniref:Uncharacterized protein n=1 Tax=Amphimedon queenslandica TaxID=400682 RepID=A0A1X7SDL0_AMPQE
LGNTLLQFAVEAGKTQVVELLYSRGHAKMAAAGEKFGIDPSGLSIIEKKEKKMTKKQKDSVAKEMLQKSTKMLSDLTLSPKSVRRSYL